MRKLILAFMLWAACASPVHAIDIFISDQPGHVGSCEDNGIFSSSFADAFNLNRGASTTNLVGSSGIGGATRIIQRYDITLIPDSAIIQSAEIVMEVTEIGSGGGDNPRLRQIATANNDWVEGTAAGATQVGSSCWNDYAYQNITEWAGSAGLSTITTDFINIVLANQDVISTTGTKTFTLNVNGISALQGQLVDNDFEVVFRNLTTTTDEYVVFATSENATTADRPYLKVTYILAGQVMIINR